MAMEQLEEDHMVQKHETIILLHPTTKPYSVSLSYTHMINCPPHLNIRGVGVSRQEITGIGNTGNLFGLFFMYWMRYRLSRTIVAVPTVITCGFLYSKYKLAYSICNHCPISSSVLILLNLKHSRINFQDTAGKKRYKWLADPKLS